MKDGDFTKPIIAVCNSFTQFVPGHVHLKDIGQLVAREIEKHGGVAKEFNTIAVDDGIAMGHDGMLSIYSIIKVCNRISTFSTDICKLVITIGIIHKSHIGVVVIII